MARETMAAPRTIAVPPERIFAILTDPSEHASIDGTGWVRESLDRAISPLSRSE